MPLFVIPDHYTDVNTMMFVSISRKHRKQILNIEKKL